MQSLSLTSISPQLPPPILRIDGLTTEFYTPSGNVCAVNRLSLNLEQKETLCLVGESGCGKSVTALSLMRLIPEKQGGITSGSIHFEDEDLATASESTMRRIRGNKISMIFQEPMTSLNPVITVGDQISESLRIHQKLSPRQATKIAIDMLALVRIADPARRALEYPHQLSGGMRQRVMIAIALACEPAVLIADEPTTALDVTIQAQILELILELKESVMTSVLLITHDLGVVAEVGQRIAVMYAGRKVEEGPVKDVFDQPFHPYTQGLLESIPRRGASSRVGQCRGQLPEIPGFVPSIRETSVGCAFAARCKKASPQCGIAAPELTAQSTGRAVACWHPNFD
ncbi:MAG: ABC transporter ATP-binding protein [Oxalobacteraceae bacterium]|jgi:peptide/nickel transport system ATP-binding protein|nr:ABC transporter ATP-binding protein [Oxalobacteraceae bacterium]NDG08225.1 ABC transporter ATP-binding protein [Oxalobacteraceae bacterium]